MQYNTLINSQLSHHVSVNDRGLNYGDGFFSTAKVVNGKVQLWQYHRARLIKCQQALGFSPIDFTQLEQDIATLCQPLSLGVLKIIITRGHSGRGYAPASDTLPTVICRTSAFPESYLPLAQQGIRLKVAKTQLAQQPALAGLKTLNRLEQVLIKQELAHSQADDLLVLDTCANVIETSSANILVFDQGKFFTPRLNQAGVKGVYLSALCDKLAVQSRSFSLFELLKVDMLFCCNSLMGLVPITMLNEREFSLDIALSTLAKLELPA